MLCLVVFTVLSTDSCIQTVFAIVKLGYILNMLHSSIKNALFGAALKFTNHLFCNSFQPSSSNLQYAFRKMCSWSCQNVQLVSFFITPKKTTLTFYLRFFGQSF